MQYPVPQFTDVEDKIIGPLSVKQFGIIFGAGILVFLPYSATKSLAVLIIAGIFFGLPALFLAFGSINGRPTYRAITYYIQYLFSVKSLVFHKEILPEGSVKRPKNEPVQTAKTTEVVKVKDSKTRLKEVQALLAQKSQEEKEILQEKETK
jgi:hypothetical protein